MPFSSGNNVGESLSNYLDVCQPVLACKAKRNHEQDSAGPSTKRTRLGPEGQEVCGYIHNVSQLRPMSCDSNKKFFTATLQRQYDIVTVTVFDQKHHRDFIDAQAEKRPVSLSHVCFGKSTTSQMSLTFNEYSQLGHMLEPGFKYDCKISEPKTVTSVSESKWCTTELITIIGQIKEEQQNCIKDIGNKQMRMIKYILTDNKTDIVLTVWGDEWNISLGAWYTFSHYTPTNVPGPGCISDPSEITLPGCQCHSLSCQSDKCQCLQRYGPAYSDQQRLLDRRDEESGYSRPVFECNALCDCSDNCSNRLVQRGVGFKLRVFPSEDRGWGVRTMEAIPCGAFVCEYAGEVIGLEEAQRRQLAQGPQDMNYIIAVREHSGQGKARETFVDPFSRGNVGRFINHSCQPNLFMVPVRVHSMVPRLALFAVRDIVLDEELTFDYSGKYNNQANFNQSHLSPENDPGESVASLQRKPCYCGALSCAGYLPLDFTVLHS